MNNITSKQTTFRNAIASGEIDDDYVAEYMCPSCRWNTRDFIRPRIGECEGLFCEETFDELWEDITNA
jgi:hypothetical protein